MGVGLQKVLQLDRRRRVAVRFVRMRHQRQIGIGHRIGILHRLDIKNRAPTGRTHLTKLFGHFQHRARRRGHIGEDTEAVITELRQVTRAARFHCLAAMRDNSPLAIVHQSPLHKVGWRRGRCTWLE